MPEIDAAIIASSSILDRNEREKGPAEAINQACP
jgi:hypothetical protein